LKHDVRMKFLVWKMSDKFNVVGFKFLASYENCLSSGVLRFTV
jgi:hypothetical protein